MSLLDQLMATGEKTITNETASLILPASGIEDAFKFISAVTSKNSPLALSLLQEFADQGVRFNFFAEEIIKLLRIMMILKVSPQEKSIMLELDTEHQKQIEEILNSLTPADIIKLIDLFMKREQEIDHAPLPQLPLEMAVVEWGLSCDMEHEILNMEQKNPKNMGQAVSSEQQTMNTEQKTEIKNIEIEKKPAEEKSIIEKVKDIISNDPVCTIKEIQNKWSDFLGKVEGHSPSLVFILKMAKIISVNGNIINLTVQYPFHCDKLRDKTTQKKLEEILSELLGKKARIDVQIVAEEQVKTDTDLQDLALALGGEVVG